MHPTILDAYATAIRSDRERAAAAQARIERGTRFRRLDHHGARARLGNALIAAGNRLAH